jgi:hypothetical protein
MNKGKKSITLNRETLRNLDEPSLNLAAGGVTSVPVLTCIPTIPPKACPTALCP